MLHGNLCLSVCPSAWYLDALAMLLGNLRLSVCPSVWYLDALAMFHGNLGEACYPGLDACDDVVLAALKEHPRAGPHSAARQTDSPVLQQHARLCQHRLLRHRCCDPERRALPLDETACVTVRRGNADGLGEWPRELSRITRFLFEGQNTATSS
jgi:hypothetical protein